MEKESKKKQIWLQTLKGFVSKHFTYKSVKDIPSEWVEKNIILTPDVSRFSGRFSYKLSPYAKEIIDHLHPANASRNIAVMKSAQSGITQGVIVPGMAYIIEQNPSNFLFTAADLETAKKTIVQRFDPLMRSSGLEHLIRPNVVRAAGKRSGDTDSSKEFAGGAATILGTDNSKKFRFFSVKTAFLDDFDAAKRTDKVEGSTRKLIEGRQTSFGSLAKTFYISTPTVTQTSNVYEMYLLGDQRKWHWPCMGCGTMVPSDWRIKKEDGSYAGIVWKLDNNNELIEDSVKFECPECGHLMSNNDKHEINAKGEWIATCKPKEKNFVSYYMNSLIIPPGFISWVDLVNEWLAACPPKQPVRVDLLKVFNNVRLGLPFEEKGEAPKIMQLMNNIREYQVGTIPDVTSENDGNGEIALITLAADLGGVMNNETEDVRIDWEIVAHSATGATYSINHGSIGTFKRLRTKTKQDLDNEDTREKLTYMHGMKNSAWPELEKIIKSDLIGESGEVYNVKLSLVDTGHFTKHAYQFVTSFIGSGHWVMGVKGVTEVNFRRNTRDVAAVKKSTNISNQYNLDVEQLKDELAENIKLKVGDDGSQGSGFMNFPEPRGKKYQLRTFFKHFESEERKEKVENGEVVGFKWDKRNSSVENHFWDVRIYNNAAKYVFLDLIKRSDPSKYKNINWASFVEFLLRK